MSTDDTEALIRALEDARFDSLVADDFEAFADLCHPDLRYTHSSAAVDTRDSLLAKCRDGYYDYRSIDHPIDEIVIAGDTALVFGEMIAEVVVGGTVKHLDNLSLTVWAKHEGDWKFRAYQPTVKPKAS